MDFSMSVIARIHSDFTMKFGIPRQSGLAPELKASIIFEPEFRCLEALRGISGFSHLWLLWVFSENTQTCWSPTVRPPRLGGNTRMGVFATRSPFRPNPIGLSCVKFEGMEILPEFGTVLHVSGADLMDNTPILDIKPYIPYADSVPAARGGFADNSPLELHVQISESLWGDFPNDKKTALIQTLAQDPRPSYQKNKERLYGLEFAGYNIKFMVCNEILTVVEILKLV